MMEADSGELCWGRNRHYRGMVLLEEEEEEGGEGEIKMAKMCNTHTDSTDVVFSAPQTATSRTRSPSSAMTSNTHGDAFRDTTMFITAQKTHGQKNRTNRASSHSFS